MTSQTSAPAAARAAPTVRRERWRALCEGPLGSVPSALALVVAVQLYDASEGAKAAIASSSSIGFLLTTLVVLAVSRLQVRPTHAMAALFAAAAVALIVAAVGGEIAFTAGVTAGLALAAASAPLKTAYWRQNLPEVSRGRWFSHVTQLEVVGSLAATVAIAWWVGDDPSRYRVPLAVIALLLLGAAWCVRGIPSVPLARAASVNPLAALAWLWRDPAFAWVNLSWTIMGFANFMILPLRVQWMADHDQGLGYPAWAVQLLAVGVPAVARLAALPLMGWLMDRTDFVRLRIAINLCFALAVSLMFTPWLPGLILGAAVLGVAFAGGDVAWTLWVTKFAPRERTADYMAVHVFLTGVRGVTAPFVGFTLAAAHAPPAVAWAAVAAIVLASLLLVPESRRRARRAAADERPPPADAGGAG